MDVPGWLDSRNHVCRDYVAEDRCKNNMPIPSERETIRTYENDEGKSAIEACCGCGGGKTGEELTCADKYLWKDADGYGCGDYHEGCADGQVVDPDNNLEMIMRYKNVEGVSATEACCECGGGGTVAEETCYDTGNENGAWKDTDGYGCMDYHEACKGGGLTEGTKIEDVTAYQIQGQPSAMDACCECGGGSK